MTKNNILRQPQIIVLSLIRNQNNNILKSERKKTSQDSELLLLSFDDSVQFAQAVLQKWTSDLTQTICKLS